MVGPVILEASAAWSTTLFAISKKSFARGSSAPKVATGCPVSPPIRTCGIERQNPEEIHPQIARHTPPAARAEYVDPLVAMRANEIAHVLDHAQDRHLHLLEHPHRLARVFE